MIAFLDQILLVGFSAFIAMVVGAIILAGLEK